MSQHIHIPTSMNFPKTVSLPGSKSLSNRVLVCAALSGGETVIDNFLDADDTRFMLKALQTHYPVSYEANNKRVIIEGSGPISCTKYDLFIGNAGTAMRFLTSMLTLGKGRFRLDGIERMRERPIGDLVNALKELGADIRYPDKKSFPPLEIRARGLAGGSCKIPGKNSSQYISSILLSAPYSKKGVELCVEGEMASRPYIDMTLKIMKDFGVDVETDYQKPLFKVAPQTYRSPKRYVIEPDASAASYFLAAGVLLGGEVRIKGLGKDSVQGDVTFLDVLARMGCVTEKTKHYVSAAPGKSLRGIDIDMNAIPDMVLTLAVLALFADGPTVIRNVPNLRIKETDRLSALATELRRIGASVEEYSDGIKITPAGSYHPAEIRTYDDHRMAMSFAIAALKIPELSIQNPGCVSKTFPNFFEVFEAFLESDRQDSEENQKSCNKITSC